MITLYKIKVFLKNHPKLFSYDMMSINTFRQTDRQMDKWLVLYYYRFIKGAKKYIMMTTIFMFFFTNQLLNNKNTHM